MLTKMSCPTISYSISRALTTPFQCLRHNVIIQRIQNISAFIFDKINSSFLFSNRKSHLNLKTIATLGCLSVIVLLFITIISHSQGKKEVLTRSYSFTTGSPRPGRMSRKMKSQSSLT